MNLTRCNNGHFYDEDKHSSCPHCGNFDQGGKETVVLERNDNVTIAVTQPQSTPAANFAPAPVAAQTLNGVVERASASSVVDDDSPTIGYYKRAIGAEPVVGWLVCIKGNHFGEDFRLRSGRNFIGRSAEMDVSIKGDSSVARDKHAVVLYDPKSSTFLIQAGESKELCYLNDELVLAGESLKAGDVISVGDTKLRFVPCCDGEFNWDKLEAPDNDK